ncbi:hypothetical protein BC829DRAFT_442912 [Chytridium lagenaria]|nr:hypothetical protein BC829DRAFT_442912 [Chytridium lagenaria]
MALLLQPWEGGRDPNSINSPLSKDEHQDLSEVSPSSSTPLSTTISDDPSSVPTSTAVSSRAITTQPTDIASDSIAHTSLAPLNPPSPSCSQPGHSSHALKHSHPDHVFSPLVNLSPALTPPRNDKQKQSQDINDPLHPVFSASAKSSGDEAMAILAYPCSEAQTT